MIVLLMGKRTQAICTRALVAAMGCRGHHRTRSTTNQANHKTWLIEDGRPYSARNGQLPFTRDGKVPVTGNIYTSRCWGQNTWAHW